MYVVVTVYLFIKIFIFVLSGSDCFRFGLMTTYAYHFNVMVHIFFVVVAVVIVVFFIMTQESRIRNSLY